MINFYKINTEGYPEVGSGTIIPDGFIEYTDDNIPSELQEAIQAEQVANELSAKIAEAKAYLANTDYKMLPNYVPKPDEDLDAIIVKRNETREFIRNYNA